MTRAMYHVENPEDYLTHRGSTIKPLTPKSEEKHKMNDEIIKHNIELENKQEVVRRNTIKTMAVMLLSNRRKNRFIF